MASIHLMTASASSSLNRSPLSFSIINSEQCFPVCMTPGQFRDLTSKNAGAESRSASPKSLPTQLKAISIRENQYGGKATHNKAAEFRRDKINGVEDFSLSHTNSGLTVIDHPHDVTSHTRTVDKSLEEMKDSRRQLENLAALRQGRILGESQVFRQTYVIRSYEVSAEGTTSIDTILSLFQEVALNHVSLLGISGTGFGATKGMNENRLIWVITRLHVEVSRYPTWPEAVEIDSWVAKSGKNGMRRDWLLREHSTGNIIAKATSTWAMMHQDTRRLAKLPDVVRAEITPVFIEKSAMEDLTFDRIVKLDDQAEHIKSNLSSCRSDLDVNQHINNVKYIRWVMESVPPATIETHEMSSVTLEYRRECQKDDIVESLTNPEVAKGPTQEAERQVNGKARDDSLNGNCEHSHHCNCSDLDMDGHNPSATYVKYTHLLRMQPTKDEIVRGSSVWKSKKSRFGQGSVNSGRQ